MTAILQPQAQLSSAELERAARAALDTVFDPELDEPITDLGFVRSVSVGQDGSLTVHLRLPTSFCSPNFAYLMASDAKDALNAVCRAGKVTVQLDDHHDSDLINTGLAADAGYVATFGAEADQGLDELRLTFRRKAHTAAMERALTSLLQSDPQLQLNRTRLADLPEGRERDALLRRRTALGLSTDPRAAVLVDDQGRGYPNDQAELQLRKARSVRISIDGNAHFCRGLLTTRYPDASVDQVPRAADPGSSRPLLPLVTKPLVAKPLVAKPLVAKPPISTEATVS